MTKKAPPPWQLPAILAGSIAALTALGTFIVKSATYIQLPDKVEAAVQKNTEQDTEITALTAIQKTWQNIYEQQQQMQQQVPNQSAPQPERRWWQDDNGDWWVCDWRCDEERNWMRDAE